jgi:hypothetical protein
MLQCGTGISANREDCLTSQQGDYWDAPAVLFCEPTQLFACGGVDSVAHYA